MLLLNSFHYERGASAWSPLGSSLQSSCLVFLNSLSFITHIFSLPQYFSNHLSDLFDFILETSHLGCSSDVPIADSINCCHFQRETQHFHRCDLQFCLLSFPQCLCVQTIQQHWSLYCLVYLSFHSCRCSLVTNHLWHFSSPNLLVLTHTVSLVFLTLICYGMIRLSIQDSLLFYLSYLLLVPPPALRPDHNIIFKHNSPWRVVYNLIWQPVYEHREKQMAKIWCWVQYHFHPERPCHTYRTPFYSPTSKAILQSKSERHTILRCVGDERRWSHIMRPEIRLSFKLRRFICPRGAIKGEESGTNCGLTSYMLCINCERCSRTHLNLL